MNYIDDITPMSLKNVKKKKESARNKKFFDIDKSSIERITLEPAKKPIRPYVDFDICIDTSIIVKNNIK